MCARKCARNGRETAHTDVYVPRPMLLKPLRKGIPNDESGVTHNLGSSSFTGVQVRFLSSPLFYASV